MGRPPRPGRMEDSGQIRKDRANGGGVRQGEAGRRCGEKGFRPERVTEAGEPSAKFGGEVPMST